MTNFTKFMNETLRLKTPTPCILHRKAMVDHKIGEFDIPKGSLISFNFLGNNYYNS